jgi:hypothetical protein
LLIDIHFFFHHHQGIHIGQAAALPLPLLPICGESREDIAAQLGMGLEILSAVSGVEVEELAKQVDTLLTDSTEHNKGVNVILQELYDLDKPAGQIFCGVHTTLGFSSTMNKTVLRIELKMGLDKLLSKFMCSMELDTKNGSLAGQALDMMLRLVAPEFKHKSWNYFGQYTHYLEQRSVPLTLFAYKDHRFGCLSRASAVLLFNIEHISSFLCRNPHITNKLACLVRELLSLPHMKVIYAAFALLGVYLIEPFYARTIATGATHSELGIFYRELFSSLQDTKVEASMLAMEDPIFPGVSKALFKSIKMSYGEKVLEVVREVAEEHAEDVVMLVNHTLPELAITLARQRRDYDLDTSSFPAQYPVQEQARNIDNTPTNNMDMEWLMGLTDQRLKKLQSLSAASRSIILRKTRALRESREKSNFRSFRQQVEDKREKEVEWNAKMAEKMKDETMKKQETALGQERKRLLSLENLKKVKGPFTNSEEVEEFLNSELPEKEKQARMKKELQFARYSSTTLTRGDNLFKIQVKPT